MVVSGLWLGLLGSLVYEIAPLDPAEKGEDQSRVVGWVTRPSVPHTSHLFDGQVDKVELYCFGKFC